jgi:enamine deaminase RidA (YjgF/YER057c/UK114 family)
VARSTDHRLFDPKPTVIARRIVAQGREFAIETDFLRLANQWFPLSIYNMSFERRVVELKLELPPAPKPVAVYKPVVIAGNMAYVSGHGPLKPDKTVITGRVGQDLDLQAGKLAARQVGLAILATLRAQLGSLDRVKRLIKVLGMVNSAPDFRDHPQVINGCSELFVEVFGPENGLGARSAVGMGSLPGNIAVEIEAIFEIQ